MKIKIFAIFLILILGSCGTNNFAKRKYTKGVYIEKRSTASKGNIKLEKEKQIKDSKTSEEPKKEALVLDNNENLNKDNQVSNQNDNVSEPSKSEQNILDHSTNESIDEQNVTKPLKLNERDVKNANTAAILSKIALAIVIFSIVLGLIMMFVTLSSGWAGLVLIIYGIPGLAVGLLLSIISLIINGKVSNKNLSDSKTARILSWISLILAVVAILIFVIVGIVVLGF